MSTASTGHSPLILLRTMLCLAALGVAMTVWDAGRIRCVADAAAVLLLALAYRLAIRSRAEDALRRSEEQFRGCFAAAAIGMALVDPDGRWLQVNRSLCEITGYSEEELLAGDFQEITHPDDLETDLVHLRGLMAGEVRSYQMEKRYIHKDGHVVTAVLSGSLVRDSGGRPVHFVAQVEDITARKELERRLEETNARLSELATTDPLTGLANRRHFETALESAFAFATRTGTPLSLALLDVDHFKAYNDAFGHQAGGKILRAVGGVLGATVRTQDLAARYGGEEFVLLLPGTDAEGAWDAAERLRAAVLCHDWPHRSLTISVGIATTAGSTVDSWTLIEEADRALYESKRSGRNRTTRSVDLAVGSSS